ncbi:MAG TPA: RNA ligase family protein [Candidatus Paceibacterota bacterium]|nr:RNA ligase family protein [Candidatus Paceibacterota bacterium]
MENKSTHKVEVVKIEKILEHPNADKMKIVKIWGFTCCVGLNQFKEGDLVAYIQPDSIVPPTKEYSFLNRGESLDDFPERRRRITVKKLRGIISQGLVMPAPEGSKEGDDVTEIMNITHYEPAPFSQGKGGGKINSGEQDKTPEGYYPNYDVDNFNRYMKVFKEGEKIVCTEKVHGANSCYSYWNNRLYARSRKLWKRPTKETFFSNYYEGWFEKLLIRIQMFFGKQKFARKESDWWVAINKHPEIKRFLKECPYATVYGEIYGKVQSLRYGKPEEVDLVLFDILIGDRWLNFDETREIVKKYNLPWVPLVYEGPYDEEKLRALAETDSRLAEQNGVDGQIMEGIVIKPKKERTDSKIGRVQLKLVSNRYYQEG